MDPITALIENIRDGIALGARFPLRHVARHLGRPHHMTRIKGCGDVWFRPNDADATILVDIFRHRGYELRRLKQYDRVRAAYDRILRSGHAPIIIDAGANIGAAALWFHAAFPQAHVIAIEPDPANLVVLRKNAEERTAIEVVAAAVGAETGKARLFNPTDAGWSARTERDRQGPIDIFSINEILAGRDAAAALFLVKIDIEGFESDLFRANLEWLDCAEVVIVEPHDWLMPGAGTSRAFVKAMLERPFEFVISGENLIYLRV